MTGSTSHPLANRKLGRVLLVEDDAVLTLQLEDALLRAGAGEVVICASMQAAMQALDQGKRADAMVLDVHLADRDDGWALAELARLLGPRSPRIVFATASPESIPLHIAGLGLVFEKPYDPDALVKALAGEPKSGFFARLRGE